MTLQKLVVGGLVAIMVSIGTFSYARAFGLPDLSISKAPSVDTVTNTVKDVTSTANDATQSLCDIITPKVDGKVSDFEDKFSKQLSYYKNERQQLQLLVEDLDSKGIDTSKVRGDLVLFDLKQQKFQDDKSDVTDGLENIKVFKCQNLLSKATGALTDAQNAQKVLKTDSTDLLNFLNTTIQNDVKALHS